MSNENRRYLNRLWLGAGVATLLAGLALAAASLSMEQGLTALPAVVIFVFVMLIVLGSRRLAYRRLEKALLTRDPSAAIEKVLRSMQRLPDADAWSALTAANHLAAYGRLEEADARLDAVAWNDKAPLVRAAGLSARGLVAYVRGEPSMGLGMMRSARVLVDGIEGFPGARVTLATYEAYVRLGQALLGVETEAVVAFFEARRQVGKWPGPLIRVLETWGLANAYASQGKEARAQELLAEVRQRAPHCTPLATLVVQR